MSLTSSIPVLRSSHYPTSRQFMELLGFTVVEEGGSPARFGIFKRDAATVFVDAWEGADPEPSPRWRGYFHTTDLPGIAERVRKAKLPFEGPNDTVYAMRELVVTDPDGNRLCFGQDI